MQKKGYYHCIECDAFFEAAVMDMDKQRCPECGNRPTGVVPAGETLLKGVDPGKQGNEVAEVLEQVIDTVQASKSGVGAMAQNVTNAVSPHNKTTPQKSRNYKEVRNVIIVWVVLTASAVALVNYFNAKRDHVAGKDKMKGELAEEVSEYERNKVLIKEAMPECTKTMTNFLGAVTTAGKAQHVYHGAKISGMMDEYYKKNAITSPSRTYVRAIHKHVLDIPGVTAIGTICQDNTGERFEVVFVRENGQWKIEWESHVRYSQNEWALFPTGNDGDEMEFRLYMRVLEVGDDIEGDDIMLVFYKPDVFRRKEFAGRPSESVRVPRDSLQGSVIRAIMEEKSDWDAYGMKLSGYDPTHFHRVRVLMRLHKKEGERRRLELVRILTNHWYGSELVPEVIDAESLQGRE